MCSSNDVDDAPVPATPETPKRVREDADTARRNAQAEAAKRFGAIGTDLTKGSLEGAVPQQQQQEKKKTLGG